MCVCVMHYSITTAQDRLRDFHYILRNVHTMCTKVSAHKHTNPHRIFTRSRPQRARMSEKSRALPASAKHFAKLPLQWLFKQSVVQSFLARCDGVQKMRRNRQRKHTGTHTQKKTHTTISRVPLRLRTLTLRLIRCHSSLLHSKNWGRGGVIPPCAVAHPFTQLMSTRT